MAIIGEAAWYSLCKEQAWRKLRLTLGADLRGPKRYRFKVFFVVLKCPWQIPMIPWSTSLDWGISYDFEKRRKTGKIKKFPVARVTVKGTVLG